LKYNPQHSIHTSRGWSGQYDRAHRWFERLNRIAAARPFAGDSLADHDFIYAFSLYRLDVEEGLSSILPGVDEDPPSKPVRRAQGPRR
jgi:hypothetical protein